MIIKTFVGDSSVAVLKQVRAELGGDAIVLKTRRVANKAGGYDVEVTACLEKTTARISRKEPAAERKVNAPVWNRVSQKPTPPSVSIVTSAPSPVESNMATINAKLETLLARFDGNQVSSRLKDNLIDMDLPAGLVNEITATTTDETKIEKLLLTQISSRIAEAPVLQKGDRVLVIGPAGSGKTSVVSRLAAQLVSRKMSVTIAGHNQRKVGSIDELASIADLIGIECSESSRTVAVRENQHAVTIIDSGDASASAEELSRLSPTHTLFVFGAIMRTADLTALTTAASAVGVTHVVMTMLDCTHRLGGLFAVCDTLGAGLALICDSPIGVSTLRPATAEVVVSRLLRKGAADAR